MNYLMRARPTTYKGIEMRSRTEALYAQRLDENGHTWFYEPRAYADGTGQYLPDFQVIQDDVWGADHFIEVKPTAEHARDALPGMHPILATDPQAVLASVYNAGDHMTPDWTTAATCTETVPCGDCHRIAPMPQFEPVRASWGHHLRMACPRCTHDVEMQETHNLRTSSGQAAQAQTDAGLDGRAGVAVDFVCGSCEFRGALAVVNWKGDMHLRMLPAFTPGGLL